MPKRRERVHYTTPAGCQIVILNNLMSVDIADLLITRKDPHSGVKTWAWPSAPDTWHWPMDECHMLDNAIYKGC